MTATELVRAADLRVGDLVDLEGDKYADPTPYDPAFIYEHQQVETIERETDDCVRVDFTEGASVGFPIDHELRVLRQSNRTPIYIGCDGLLSVEIEINDAGDIEQVYLRQRDHAADMWSAPEEMSLS